MTAEQSQAGEGLAAPCPHQPAWQRGPLLLKPRYTVPRGVPPVFQGYFRAGVGDMS